MVKSKSDESLSKQEVAHDDDRGLAFRDERAVQLAIARQADPGPRAFSLASFQLLFYVLVCCMCGGDSGFDGTIMGSVNSMVQFQEYFNLDKSGASKTGILFVSINACPRTDD